jgi:formate--tetrahydrofolate ligase
VKPIAALAEELGLDPDAWEPYGRHVAKLDPRVGDRRGRLVLVTAITPTVAGEGKTTTSIGLAQGLRRLGASACLALREPSVGPCFGAKGGGTGSGRAALFPADRINLHFTGDLHAIGAAHNLLAALLDNHLHFGNARRIDPRRVTWRRVVDLNDRALRHLVVGLGGTAHGVPREDGFYITAASEVMAMLCLASDAEDLRARLERTVIAFDAGGAPVTAADLKAPGAMLALLRDALRPNLVQTVEGVPALVHGGPFANIAHGCNSVVATRAALRLADWAVTEAGFGTDLGAEKFFHLKCRSAGLDPAVVVLVATVRALKLHGGAAPLAHPDPDAVVRGLPNLDAHVDNVRAFGRTPVVALNRFSSDHADEIAAVAGHCASLGVPFAVSDHHDRGGDGALDLARAVVAEAERATAPFTPLYPAGAPAETQIATIARRLYGAAGVAYTREATHALEELRRLGFDHLPVCVAKTHQSLSDDPTRHGRPTGFTLNVEHVELAAGAGFLVFHAGDIVRMPGLPRVPRAEHIDLVNGEIVGLE